MGILIAAVVLLTALTLFNLMLTLAIVRRLRTAAGPGRSAPRTPDLDEVPSGASVPHFTAQSVTGAPVSSAGQRGDRAVYAFFDTGCGVCEHQLQPLVDFARRAGLTPEQVIVFIGDDEGEAERYVSVVEGHTTVVMQAVHEEAGRAFALHGVPAFVLADADGTVLRSSVEVKDLEPAFAGA